MLLEQFRIRHGAQRRPPQLRAEAFRVYAVDEGSHVLIAIRKFFRIQFPIANIVLPTVVESDPLEAESFCCRQGIVDLLRTDGASVAPSAPDRAFAVRRRTCRAK